jgi:hypothetical protein
VNFSDEFVDDRCRCAEGQTIRAPWPYMGPWHDEGCWLFGAMNPPSEDLLAGERYDEDMS